jgi:chloramphenicol 3-O phosphotransferase
MNRSAQIILLNGVGSSGKSSIAKALQKIADRPFLHVQMDEFCAMLPEALQDHPDGFAFEEISENGKPLVVIKTGPVGARAMRGMRHAIAAMAAQGNNLVVDDVMLDTVPGEYAALLSGFETFFVGVFAPLDVLEVRERQRGDRMIGLARWQYDRVHRGKKYDLEIDTGSLNPQECAALIKQKFQL